jgi:alpha-beta hydrolase superfamily lysophospholipase
VCTYDYRFSGTGNENRIGRFYAPVLEVVDENHCLTHGPSHILLIFHADGANHTSYDQLARHLASNALIVTTVDRTGTQIEEFADLLRDHLTYIYQDSLIKDFVTNDITIMGHSAGGRAVTAHAGIIHDETTKNLKAVILLASTVNLNLEKTLDSFNICYEA